MCERVSGSERDVKRNRGGRVRGSKRVRVRESE